MPQKKKQNRSGRTNTEKKRVLCGKNIKNTRDKEERKSAMKTREEALSYGLSFPDTYQEAPFHDDNWQLIRVKGSKKAFLWSMKRTESFS